MRHPNVPESLDSWWILHQMFAFDRLTWDQLPQTQRTELIREAQTALEALKTSDDTDVGLAQMVGHRADLMITHYSKNYDGLAHAQTVIDKLRLTEYLASSTSYVSILELGLYDATAKIHAALSEQNLKPNTQEWNQGFDDLLKEQEKIPHHAGRLWAKIPQRRYVCFYPMDKKRGEDVNWFMLSYEERSKLMLEHGKIGRTFHGLVTQVISGSIGYDNYEWGVDLYADDPLVFKKLIYEMRFDEASAKYGHFGEFYSGMQFSLDQLETYLDGHQIPALNVLQPALKA
ncbi:MAG: hydrogen peroxide-dependent heme synthase [Candidatus Melainabacteria bacterium]|mgnify:CR=1 FL=1|nr:hydrogen peroxide-dependent heme synthase [Candidatus Melainabacteria bacterium]